MKILNWMSLVLVVHLFGFKLQAESFNVDEIEFTSCLYGIQYELPFKVEMNGKPWKMDAVEKAQLKRDLYSFQDQRSLSLRAWNFVIPDIGANEMIGRFEVWTNSAPKYAWRVAGKKSGIHPGAEFRNDSTSGKSFGFKGYSTNNIGIVRPQYAEFKDFGESNMGLMNFNMEQVGPAKWFVVSQENNYSSNFIRNFSSNPIFSNFEERYGASDSLGIFTNPPLLSYSMYYYKYDSSVSDNLPNVQATLYGIGHGYKMPISTEHGKVLEGFRFDNQTKLSFYSRSVVSRPDSLDVPSGFIEEDIPGYSVMVAMNIERLQPAIPYLDKALHVQDMGKKIPPNLSKQKNTFYYWDSAQWGNDSGKIWADPYNFILGGEVAEYGGLERVMIEKAIIAEDLKQKESDIYPVFIWRRQGISRNKTEVIDGFFKLPENSRILNDSHCIVIGGGGTYDRGDGNIISYLVDSDVITPQMLIENKNGGGYPLIRLQ